MALVVLESPKARGAFKEWRDTLAKKSLHQADYAWTVLQRIFSVAKDRKDRSQSPERGGRLYEADRTENLWTDDHTKQFLERAPEHLPLPLMLAVWEGAAALLVLPWSAHDGQFIRLRQRKGKKGKGRRVKIPVSALLKAMLDRTRRVATVVLTTTSGMAWTEDGFRSSWGKACGKSGMPNGLTFHGLRGTAVTRLAEAGCEDHNEALARRCRGYP